MKLITPILAVYFLGLTFMPCPERVGVDQYDSEIQYRVDFENSFGDIDFCSPFCGSSCQINIISHQSDYFWLDLSVVSKTSHYRCGLIKDVISFILQPPKL